MSAIESPNKSIYISYVKSIEANVSALEKFLAGKGYKILKRHLSADKSLLRSATPIYSVVFCITKDYMRAIDNLLSSNLKITADSLESVSLARSLIENSRVVIALLFEDVPLMSGYFAEIAYEMVRINFFETAKEHIIWQGPFGQHLVDEIERGRKLQEKSLLNFRSFIISKSHKDFQLIVSKETATSTDTKQLGNIKCENKSFFFSSF
jgi:hypothetical protein